MKKILALVLALVLALSMTAVAFAEDEEPVLEGVAIQDNAMFGKSYITVGADAIAPAETFTFTFKSKAYKAPDDKDFTTTDENPKINNVTTSFKEGQMIDKMVPVTINTDDFNLGVYKYEVTEIAGETTGVTYSEEKLYLVLTITRDESNGKHYVAAFHYEKEDGTKVKGFTNQYDAGKLTVTKEITGNIADMSKKFKFTVVFAPAEGTTIKSTIGTDTATTKREYTVSKDRLTYEFVLGDGETATFTNLPAGATYTVTETNENYTIKSKVNDNGTIESDKTSECTFINELTTIVDTGIVLDNLPYIVLMGLVVLAGVVMMMKKRSYND